MNLLKQILAKFRDWWWHKYGFNAYMRKLERKQKKTLIVNIYTDVD